MSLPTDHVTVVLTRREAEQVAGGKPDTRAWRSLRRKCNKAVIDHDEAMREQSLFYEWLTSRQGKPCPYSHPSMSDMLCSLPGGHDGMHKFDRRDDEYAERLRG